jgi:CxxC motif-containing protein
VTGHRSHDPGGPPASREPTTHLYLCTGCPLGCQLEVDVVDDDVIEVRGFGCKLGERYGAQEHLDPRRTLATTVWIEGAIVRRAPVRTAEPVPKSQLRAVARALHGVRLRAPVRRGEVVLADVLGSGIDVIITRDLAAVEERTDGQA